MSAEHALQNAIRNALAGKALIFRANVGKGWNGNKVISISRRMTVVAEPGDVLIKQARPFDTGLPVGFSDLFGLVSVTITPEMVGQTVGVFVGAEVKDEFGRVSPKQAAFLQAVNDNGGRAGIVRSIQDAEQLIAGER